MALGITTILTIGMVILILGSWGIEVYGSVVETIETKDPKPLLISTGGRVLMLDKRIEQGSLYLAGLSEQMPERNNTLVNETEVLPFLGEDMPKMVRFFLLLDMLIFVLIFYALFTFGKWIVGKQQGHLFWQIGIMIAVFVTFFLLETVYTQYVTGQVVVPMRGPYVFFKNIFKIFAVG